MTVEDKYVMELAHTPIDGSVHVYCNGCQLMPQADYTWMDAKKLKTKYRRVLRGDRLEARYAYMPDGTAPSGGGSGSGSTGGTPGTTRRPTVPEDLGGFKPGSGPCAANASIWNDSAAPGAGVLGADGYFNLTIIDPTIVMPRRPIEVRGVTFGARGSQTFQWLERTGTGFIGYLCAVWVSTINGCGRQTDITSGSLGGHGEWNGSTYVYPESSWRTQNLNPPSGTALHSGHTSNDYYLLAIYTAPGGGGITPSGGRGEPYNMIGAAP